MGLGRRPGAWGVCFDVYTRMKVGMRQMPFSFPWLYHLSPKTNDGPPILQGMLSLRASVEVMRCNVMQQQVRVMEEEPALAAAAGCSKKGGACRKGTGAGTGGEGGECDGSHTSAAASGGEGRRPPSEEATGEFLCWRRRDDVGDGRCVVLTRTNGPTFQHHPTETAPGAAADADASQSGKEEKKKKKKSRVEFVPVEWFDAIRSDEGSLTRKVGTRTTCGG